jgi:hypothetical protein
MAGGRASRATISGRGGTTGRAAGCPAKFGFAGGRSGAPPPVGSPAEIPGVGGAGGGIATPGVGAAGLGRIAGRGGTGREGAAPGRGAPGVVIADGCAADIEAALGASATPGGSGCLGPDKICPGRAGGGTGRDGITGPRFAGVCGTLGCPVASGGRKGNAGRTGAAGGSAAGVISFAGAASAGTCAGSDLIAGRTGSGAAGATGAAAR